MRIEKSREGNMQRYECWDTFTVVGFAVVQIEERAHILDINVRREWRGHGVGSELLAAILEDFGDRRITAEVFRERLPWYERNGFRRVGEKGPLVVVEFSKDL
jgi:ribosomal protein S18 acetylase RimI-like enzyme